MKDILNHPLLREFARTASNMYRLGWDERNGGNISLLLKEEDLEGYLDISHVKREIPLMGVNDVDIDLSSLEGRIFLVTGTGRYFKNVEGDPSDNLGIVRIAKGGKHLELLWGFEDGGRPTSEFPAHMMSHAARLSVDPGNRVVMHCHPTNILAMNFVHELDERSFTRSLWQMCTECIVVFPEGIGILPWMLCGTSEIGEATAEKMKEFRLVVWAMHGVYGSGKSLDEAFGLIETVEKAAEIWMMTSHLPRINTIKDEDMKKLLDLFKVTNYRKDFLDL